MRVCVRACVCLSEDLFEFKTLGGRTLTNPPFKKPVQGWLRV